MGGYPDLAPDFLFQICKKIGIQEKPGSAPEAASSAIPPSVAFQYSQSEEGYAEPADGGVSKEKGKSLDL